MPHNDTPARLALVGPSSLLGREIKDQLAASGFPSDGVTLFDLDDVAGVLTEYGDEARVLAETITENLLDHELVCFCGDRAAASEHLEAVLASDRLSIDCVGAWAGRDDAFLWIPGTSTPPNAAEAGAVVIPPAAVIAVAELTAALGDLATRAAVSVFVPASELGDRGLEEMSQQSTAVLNLLDFETDVFGRQQAFDMWPLSSGPLGDQALGVAVESLGLARPGLNVVSTPVFHGMSLSAFVPDATPEHIQEMLAASDIHDSLNADLDSPRGVIGEEGLHLLDMRADGQGMWLWLAADNLALRAAATVAAIHALLGVSVSDEPQ